MTCSNCSLKVFNVIDVKISLKLFQDKSRQSYRCDKITSTFCFRYNSCISSTCLCVLFKLIVDHHQVISMYRLCVYVIDQEAGQAMPQFKFL